MSQLDDVVERVRRDANALYAFVMTRRGQLVTRDALRDVPEAATGAISAAADAVAGSDRVVTVRLTHRDLVPKAIAEPVDCHVGVAAERAVICLVMLDRSDVRRASAALQVAVRVIEPMLARYMANQPQAAGADSKKAQGRAVGPGSGKKSRFGKDSTPEIAVEPARRLGAETMNAIEEEIKKSGIPVPNPDIPRDLLRTTLPYKSTSSEPDSAPEPLAEGAPESVRTRALGKRGKKKA